MMQFSIIPLPKGSGRYIVAFSLLSLLYVSIVPFCWVDKTNRFTRHEGRYIEATKLTIFTRFMLMIAGASLGLDNIYYTLAFDMSTLAIYYSIVIYRKQFYNNGSRIVKALFPYRK